VNETKNYEYLVTFGEIHMSRRDNEVTMRISSKES